MKRTLMFALLLAAAGIASAQSPAPFDMNQERGQERLPSAPPITTPGTRPLSAAPPAGGDARAPATGHPTPALPPSASSELAARRYLVPDRTLQLRGEGEQRSWSIYLTPDQAAAPAKLHVGYQNSIVVAPEASRLAVVINDIPIHNDQISSPEGFRDRVIDIPAGTLKAGFNLIRFRADQRHRTDCTIESTFELWTEIDPERTFLTFDAPNAGRFSRLDDIRAVGVDNQGNTRFRLIVPALDQLGATDVLMRLSQGLALMSGMPNQSFTFEKTPSAPPQPGELAIFVGTHDELKPILPALPDSTRNGAAANFLDYPGAAGVSTFVLSGPGWPAIEGLVNSLISSTNGAAAQRRETLATQSWHGIDTPFLYSNASIDFTRLGIESQEFSGRLFRTRFTIGVPSDFYANAYGEARILLDAAYTSEVQPGSHIDVFVNGNIASTVPITSDRGGVFRHLPIKMTLRHFRPGVNTIDIEAALLTSQDTVCAPGTPADPKARFALFGSSQFHMPNFARIAQVPNLAATAGTGFPYRTSPPPVSLFLGRINEQTLAAAATFLGKMAEVAQYVIPVDVTTSAARVSGVNALFVGAISEFPANVLAQLKIDQDSRSNWTRSGSSPKTAGDQSLTLQDWQQRSGTNFFARQFSIIGDWAKENFDLSLAMLRFAPATEEFYKPPPTAQMIIAQQSDPTELGTWTAVISPDTDLLADGMRNFSTRSEWDKLKGRITVYEGADKEPSEVPVGQFRFSPTQPLSFENARLIAANWLSDNIMSYALLLGAGSVLLGLATGGLLTLLGRDK